MLFDRRKALPQVNRDILAAADYIREYGWCQGRLGELGGPACIQGALFAIVDEDKWDFERYLGAVRHVDKVLGEISFFWNDCPGRTKTEVVDTLEAIGWDV